MLDNEKEEAAEKLEALLEQKNYPAIRPLLSEYNAIDLAEILGGLDRKDIPLVFRLLPKEQASDIFVEMDSDTQEHLITLFSDKELKDVIGDLYLDDVVDLVEEMPSNLVKRILKQADSETRDWVNKLLNYPKDSAGSIMTIEYVKLRPEMTVEAAFDRIRETGLDKETIYTCYVTDVKNKLVGIVSARTLLLADKKSAVGDIMEENVISVGTLTDKEEVAREIDRYGFLAMPVVDMENRLVGIVTVDDAMDILREENNEDIAKMAGITPDETPYLKTGVFKIWLNRVPWLLLLMVSATFTGLIINNYEGRLNALSPLLFACIPMLMDTGGNAGSQVSVTIIRGLALKEVRFKDTLKVIFKELRVSLLLAATVAAACFLKLIMIDNWIFGYKYDAMLSAIVAVSLFFTIVLAKLVGCLLPMLAQRFKLDPAVVASPFITTIVDALSLIIYCNIAIAVLG